MKRLFLLTLLSVLSLNVFAQTVTYYGRYAGGVGLKQNTLQRASALGYNAKVSVNDGLVLGDTSLVKVGIGLSNPRYRLDVKGVFNMRIAYESPALKINDQNFIELDDKGQFLLNPFKMKYSHENQWADRVFEQNYQLKPLKEVAEYVAQNKHLPGVPPAAEVVKNGIAIDAMVARLLEKVEELTLYTIQQQKEIDELKKRLGKK
jgi:hypothetical protein